MIQIGLFISACAAIWLISRKEDWRKWGFLVGLIGQPLWLIDSYMHEQWGIFLVSIWFFISYAQGVRNFILGARRDPNDQVIETWFILSCPGLVPFIKRPFYTHEPYDMLRELYKVYPDTVSIIVAELAYGNQLWVTDGKEFLQRYDMFSAKKCSQIDAPCDHMDDGTCTALLVGGECLLESDNKL